MAGGAVVSNGKGGRKSVDAAINLVPFIDLLSCCLAFLLITAVWVNLSQVPVHHGASSEGGANPPPVPSVQLTLLLSPDGYVLQRSTGETTHLSAVSGELDYKGLANAMRQLKRELPHKEDITIRSSDGVIYDRLIQTIDIVRAEQFPDVNVTDTGHDS